MNEKIKRHPLKSIPIFHFIGTLITRIHASGWFVRVENNKLILNTNSCVFESTFQI